MDRRIPVFITRKKQPIRLIAGGVLLAYLLGLPGFATSALAYVILAVDPGHRAEYVVDEDGFRIVLHHHEEEHPHDSHAGHPPHGQSQLPGEMGESSTLVAHAEEADHVFYADADAPESVRSLRSSYTPKGQERILNWYANSTVPTWMRNQGAYPCNLSPGPEIGSPHMCVRTTVLRI